jgi:hypothetical protein
MSRTTKYFVVLDRDEWKIKQNGGPRSEPYPSQKAAIKDAVSRASADFQDGKKALVLVQDQDFLFRPEWPREPSQD